MNSTCRYGLWALASIVFFSAKGICADTVVKAGSPADYAADPNLKVFQSQLANDRLLASQGKLTETDLLKNNVHNAAVNSESGIVMPISSVATSTSPALAPYQSCSSMGRPGDYGGTCWTEQYAEVCDPSTGHCHADPFADLPGVWDCSRCNIVLDATSPYNQLTYKGLEYGIYDKTCDYSSDSIDPHCPIGLDTRPKPSGAPTSIAGIRFWGNQDGNDYLELYGNFQSASDLTFSCGDDKATEGFVVTYASTTQMNIKAPPSLIGKTCWIGTKQSPQQQLIQVPPADPKGLYFVSGILRDKTGRVIPNTKVIVRYTDFFGQQSGTYGEAMTDDQGRYVIPTGIAQTGPRGGGGVYQLEALDSANNEISVVSYYDIPASTRQLMQQQGFAYVGDLLHT